MDFLQHTIHLTPAGRRVVAVLACIVTLTSTHVQVIHAESPSRTSQDVTRQVVAYDTIHERGFVVPVGVEQTMSGSSFQGSDTPSVALARPRSSHVWNRVNAPDLDAVPMYSSESAIRTLVVQATAYSSDPRETDDSPFTTANGTRVRDGIIAANFLALGTRVRIPEYFGEKVFEVQDRMNPRFAQRIDIWMLHSSDVRRWGIRRVTVEILP